MYKNLSADGLGISGRQSELIELSLTYGFRGLDLDIQDLIKRAQSGGVESACRFLESAKIEVGGFELPVRWLADEPTYKSDLEQLEVALEISAALGGKCCYTMIQPGSDELPYHENFELHRKRLAELAAILAKREMRLGLGLLAAPAHRVEKRFEFIYQADALLTLVKTVGAANVGLLYDTWNWHVGGGTLEQIRECGADGIVAVRIADAPADMDLAAAEETDRIPPSEEGAIDVPAIIALLNELGYEGPVSMYADPSRYAGRTREAIVQEAQTALDELLKTLEPGSEDDMATTSSAAATSQE
jgi:sugar phosphate isomerase/epimerase